MSYHNEALKDKVYRILEIIRLLETTNKKWKAQDFAEYFGISRRTFHRDKELMRKKIQIPIRYEPSERCYVLEKKYNFDPPDLKEREAVAIILLIKSFDDRNFPYYKELLSARTKFVESLSSYKRKIIEKLDDRILLDNDLSINLSRHLDTIKVIEKAIDRERKLKINYYSLSSDETRKRTIAPYGIAYREGAGYVIGFCYLRNEKRIFRIDRIEDIHILQEGFSRPESFSLEDYFEDTWGVERGKKRKVEIIFTGFAARFVSEGEWHDSQKIYRIDEDRIRYSVETGSMKEMKRWILSFGKEAEVIEPSELREELEKEIEAMQERY
ncbi:MAG: helix-turn-helix transcriptional regulator [Halanaerobiales bacterium]